MGAVSRPVPVAEVDPGGVLEVQQGVVVEGVVGAVVGVEDVAAEEEDVEDVAVDRLGGLWVYVEFGGTWSGDWASGSSLGLDGAEGYISVAFLFALFTRHHSKSYPYHPSSISHPFHPQTTSKRPIECSNVIAVSAAGWQCYYSIESSSVPCCLFLYVYVLEFL